MMEHDIAFPPRRPEAHAFSIVKPEPSEWVCRITRDLTLHPNKGNEPNWFHRWMQRLAFGFKWERATNGKVR
jgi:hypothetical protein